MADWFVDGTVAGGNGTDPASAFASVLSAGGSTMSAGDRMWIRKTQYELLTSSQYLGPNSLIAGGTANSKRVHIIGWPSSGDPWYNERPPRGTTVGWDSDVCSMACNSLYGLNMPTIACSDGGFAGILTGYGTYGYNICIQNNGQSKQEPFANFNSQKGYLCFWENCILNMNSGDYDKGAFQSKGVVGWGKLTMIFSVGVGGSWFLGNSNLSTIVRHLIISSKSVGTTVIAANQATNPQRIGTLQIDTSSVTYLMNYNLGGNIGQNDAGDGIAKIGRVCGTRPYSGISSLGVNGYFGWHIDDYFGEGPRTGVLLGPAGTRVASINEAAVNIGSYNVASSPVAALIYFCQSYAAGNQTYMTTWPNNIVMKAYFDVTSGTQIEIRVPIYVDSTAIYSLFNGGIMGELNCVGGGVSLCTGSNVLVGSPTLWSGSLIAGGSAWIWSSKFTPKETAFGVPFDVYMTHPTQANSGQGLTFNLFLGQPYHV